MRTRDTVEDLLGSSVAPPPIIAPTFDRHGDDFTITWSEHALNFAFTEVHKNRDGIKAELAIQLAGSEIHFGALSLASTTAREQLVRKLSEIAPDLGWRTMLEHACRATVDAIRRGTPAVLLSPRPAPATRHLVEPLLLENDINVVFGPPGTLKSLIAAVAARLAATKGQLASLSAYRKCPVMIVDGEANLTEWERRSYLLNQGHPESAGGLAETDRRWRVSARSAEWRPTSASASSDHPSSARLPASHSPPRGAHAADRARGRSHSQSRSCAARRRRPTA